VDISLEHNEVAGMKSISLVPEEIKLTYQRSWCPGRVTGFCPSSGILNK
jgi:hypothetical protein